MPRSTQHPVAILYEHSLLGEGIAKYLRAKTNVEVTLASARDLEAVQAALAAGPRVVIFERSEPLGEIDLAKLAPHAVLIDVSTAICQGPAVSRTSAGFEWIIQAIRRSVTPARNRHAGGSRGLDRGPDAGPGSRSTGTRGLSEPVSNIYRPTDGIG